MGSESEAGLTGFAQQSLFCSCEQNHQGLGNELIGSDDQPGSVAGSIERSERLGGILKHDHLVA
jgi:hypothetical protein